MIVISDTSALSAFAETDLLSVLPAIFGSIVITASVHHECRHPRVPAHLQAWIGQHPAWLRIVPDPDSLLPETASLGNGEASAISLAWEQRQNSRLILDERRGRRVARALGLPVIGVVAICAEAANRGLVDFDDTLRRLRAADFHISDAVIAEVRARLR